MQHLLGLLMGKKHLLFVHEDYALCGPLRMVGFSMVGEAVVFCYTRCLGVAISHGGINWEGNRPKIL